MTKKYRIVYDRANCISAGVCVAMAPAYWVLDAPDGLADIHPNKKPTKRADGWQELVIDEEHLEENLEAARGCPAQIIFIYDEATGRQIYPKKEE